VHTAPNKENIQHSKNSTQARTPQLPLRSVTTPPVYILLPKWTSFSAPPTQRLPDDTMRADVLTKLERGKKRWAGERVEGDYHGDTIWQAIQNVASALGIDVGDENDPLVRGLRVAAKDSSSKRVLATCEHLLDSLGATGPIARQIARMFNITTAGSKVIHCTLHNYHVEGKDIDSAYADFRKRHCDSCPDRKPRPEEWRGTTEEIRQIQSIHRDFVQRLNGTPNGFRFTDED